MRSKKSNFSNAFFAIEANWNIFLALAHFKSLTVAADHLDISQSAVSKALSSMEKSLGFPLFDRTCRPIMLTPQGDLLLNELSDSGEKLERLLLEVRANKGLPFSLRFGCVESVCRYIVPNLIIKYSGEFSKISQTSGHSQILLDKLLNRELDIILSASEYRDTLGLFREEIYSEPSILILPTSIPDKDEWTWRDLQNLKLPLIFSTEPSAAGKLNQRFLSRMRMHFPNRCETDSDVAMMRLIELNYGWTISRPSTFLSSNTSIPHVRIKKLPAPGFNRKLYLVCKEKTFEDLTVQMAEWCRKTLNESLRKDCRKIIPWLENL